MHEQQEVVFYTAMYGEIHKNEAIRWFNSLRRFSKDPARPLVALIDLTAVTFIGGTARIQLADSTRLPCVKALIFIATEPHILQAIRMIGMLGERGSTHVFANRADAQQFSHQAWGVDLDTAKV